MARIPIPEYQQTQVPGGVPGTPRGPMLPGSSVTAESVARLGAVAQDALLKFQSDSNQAAVDDAYNTKFSPAFRELYNGYYQLQGKDAVDERPNYEAKMQELRNQTREALPDGPQRRLFDDISRRRVEGELDGMARHAAAQRLVYMAKTSDATLDNYTRDAADKYNDEGKFAGALQSGLAEIDRYGRSAGQSSEVMRARAEAFVSKAWTQRIERIMLDDPLNARDLYRAHQSEVDAATRPLLEHKLKVAAIPVEARVIADHAMTGADMAELSNAIEKSDGQLLRVVDRQQAAAAAAPTKVLDTRAALGGWIATGEAAARRLYPGNPQVADLVTNIIKSRVATIAQAQEGIQKQKQGVLIDLIVKAKPNGIDELLRRPEARAAWVGLDPQAQLGIIHLAGRTSDEEKIKTSPSVFLDALNRIHAKDSDPAKIRSSTDLVGLVGKGLSFTDYQRLQHEYDRSQTPEGNRFVKDVQTARHSIRTILHANPLGQVMGDVAEEAAYRAGAELDAKIEQYRKDGKDPRDLLTPGKPDYFLAPEKLASFMPNARAAVGDAAAKAGAPKAPAPVKLDPKNADAEFAALPKGTKYIGPDGITRTKP